MPLRELLTGVTLAKKARMRASQVRVGSIDLTDHFTLAQVDGPPRRYYTGRTDTVVLKAKDPRALERLRLLLLAFPSPLEVHLVDRADSWMRRAKQALPFLVPARFEAVITVAVDVGDTTPCDAVTVIAYRNVNSILRRELEKSGQTESEVTLDDVFALLLEEQIEPYLDTLDAVQRSNPCFTRFELLKWLRNEDVTGFEFKEYRLSDGIRGLLESLLRTLTDLQLERRAIKFSVTGYTDAVGFFDDHTRPPGTEPIVLKTERTGIDNWRLVPRPLSVYYDGCVKNTITGQPVMIELHRASGTPVANPLGSNCELGAVRAYVTAVFLESRLGATNIRYEYATGGARTAAESDRSKRRVEVRVALKGARKD